MIDDVSVVASENLPDVPEYPQNELFGNGKRDVGVYISVIH